jgi:hypothetical protein
MSALLALSNNLADTVAQAGTIGVNFIVIGIDVGTAQLKSESYNGCVILSSALVGN